MPENKENQAAVSPDALEKALSKLNDLAKSSTDEKQALLQKAMNSELSGDETARLQELLGGGSAQVDTLAKSATANLQPQNSPAVAAAVDVSEYLNAFHSGQLDALSTLADTMEKSDARQSEYNILLAKAVTQIGHLVKSLDARLETWGSEAVEQPKGARTPTQAKTVMQKSFAGQQGEGDQINKSEILSLLEEMHIDSLQKGRGGSAHCGEDLNKSIAKYEQTGKMTRALVDEMKAFRAKHAAA